MSKFKPCLRMTIAHTIDSCTRQLSITVHNTGHSFILDHGQNRTKHVILYMVRKKCCLWPWLVIQAKVTHNMFQNPALLFVYMHSTHFNSCLFSHSLIYVVFPKMLSVPFFLLLISFKLWLILWYTPFS